MAFSQADILDVVATRDGAEVVVSWRSSAPAGSVYQLYVDRVLRWHGTATSAVLALGGTHRIDVGTVGAGEGSTDFSSSLAASAATSDRVELTWSGGSYEKTTLDVAGFRVYSSSAPGGAINYAAPVGTVAVATQGVDQGGWGQGGWGQGGWGATASTYTWTSGRLCPGVWQFAVKPYDVAGNEGTAATASATVTRAPLPPAANPAGQRLTYSNFHTSGGSAYADLAWLASPACP